jgi:hypothetical protein
MASSNINSWLYSPERIDFHFTWASVIEYPYHTKEQRSVIPKFMLTILFTALSFYATKTNDCLVVSAFILFGCNCSFWNPSDF